MRVKSSIFAFFLGIIVISGTSCQDLNTKRFPDDFLLGVATAAYQIEGAWNISDKSESIWDHLTHYYPELVMDRSNGDVACNSYYKVKDDVAMLKNLGVDFYRFSISWTRLLPNGFSNKVSEDGLRYYNELIDALVEANIIPFVTLYHWDLPVVLQNLGGWTNPLLSDYFADYAEVAFKHFGDRVKHWITFNEPSVFCSGYAVSAHAPVNVKQPGIGNYMCAHTMIRSHAKAYHIYNETYKPTQKGVLGITLACSWAEANTTSASDLYAQEIQLEFSCGLYANAIFSQDGDHPEIVKSAIYNRSMLEGFPYSRLPQFTKEEVEFIRGSSDFFGLNHYTSNMVTLGQPSPVGDPDGYGDTGVQSWFEPSWEESASPWLRVVPWGFRKILLWLHNKYHYPIYVTENGFSDNGELNDDKRISYYQRYLSALLDAVDQGANVKGYTAWSLMDNFEWLDGYVNRFGIHFVNMSDPDRPRMIKKSGEYIKQVISSRVITTNVDDTTSTSTSTLKPTDKLTEKPGNGAYGMSSTKILSLLFIILFAQILM